VKPASPVPYPCVALLHSLATTHRRHHPRGEYWTFPSHIPNLPSTQGGCVCCLLSICTSSHQSVSPPSASLSAPCICLMSLGIGPHHSQREEIHNNKSDSKKEEEDHSRLRTNSITRFREEIAATAKILRNSNINIKPRRASLSGVAKNRSVDEDTSITCSRRRAKS
jgi:hypothetical protein